MRARPFLLNLGGVLMGLEFVLNGAVKLLGGQFDFSHD
jgi:hypothetical protein